MIEKRSYNLGRRAESSAETRQRLVEATAALHSERGITAVSLRDVAERAGVSVGTAYHHFPTYLDAIEACGQHTALTSPMPQDSMFDGVRGVEARVTTLIRELCAWYEQRPWFEHIRAERALYPPVDQWMKFTEQELERIAKLAADCTLDEARTLAALADVSVYRSLRRAGIPQARAAARIAEVAMAWLRSGKKKRKQR